MAKQSRAETTHKAYEVDLAYIHDVGFGEFAAAAARFLLEYLPAHGLQTGRIVELGCGSGIQAEAMTKAGYNVLGYDISPAMVALAAKRAPAGEFRCTSFLDVKLPECQVVTAVGEIFNYLFDDRNSPADLSKLFRRVYGALAPGGVFLFDVALVGRIPEGTRRTYVEHDDWACLYEGREDAARHKLERHITTFRRDGALYRRSHEVHRLRLYDRGQFLAPLRKIGFRVRTLARYGPLRLPPGYQAYLCHK
jgi:SAM-dependent methyltransferase